MVIQYYNHGMGGVDVFDQRAAAFRIQRRALKYYKSIVFAFIDVIILNSQTLFNDCRSTHPGEIPRPSKYSQKDFRVALVCQLAGIGEDEPVPQFKPLGRPVNPLPPITHLPEAMPIRRNCRYCFRIDHVERKCQVRCPTCNVFLHVERRNCFMLYHLNMLWTPSRLSFFSTFRSWEHSSLFSDWILRCICFFFFMRPMTSFWSNVWSTFLPSK